MGAPDVFEYLDYRAYLRDYGAHAARSRRGFSASATARKSGLGSTARLSRVMAGEAALAVRSAGRLATALGLGGDAASHFVELVRYAEGRTRPARERAYAKLMRSGPRTPATKLAREHAAYHGTWYLPAIRELAGRADFEADPRWIASRLVPAIEPAQARSALRTLLRLGLLQRDRHGRVTQRDALLTTGPEAHTLHVAGYHRAMMARASASIELVPSDGRDISAVTMLVAKGGVGRVKQLIRVFRRQLLDLAMAESGPSQVVQLNVQLFPLSVPPEQEPPP